MPRLVLLSDTHGKHRRVTLPDGDILIHAGDFTHVDSLKDLHDFHSWFGHQPHKYKVMIAGNHDECFENKPARAQGMVTMAQYLQDGWVTYMGLKIYGSPWQPKFCDWAFNLSRGAALKAKWDLIPDDTDVLVTHGPPYERGDFVNGDRTGCRDLLDAIKRIKPKLHVCGHIHAGYGITTDESTIYANASTCDERYQPVNPPLVVDL